MNARRRIVYLYVNDRHVGAIYTAWPLKRCLAHLRAVHPHSQSREASYEPRAEYERLAPPDGCERTRMAPRLGANPPPVGE
jgi:hypothetical protein